MAAPEYALTNASAPAEAKICAKASGASACTFVLRGCMFLLSLTATCQVCTVSLKAGQSTYNPPAADCLQRLRRSRVRQRLTRGVAMTANVKSGRPLCLHWLGPLTLRPWAEPEPGSHDGGACCEPEVGDPLPCGRRGPASRAARGCLAASARRRGWPHTGAAALPRPRPHHGSTASGLAPGWG